MVILLSLPVSLFVSTLKLDIKLTPTANLLPSELIHSRSQQSKQPELIHPRSQQSKQPELIHSRSQQSKQPELIHPRSQQSKQSELIHPRSQQSKQPELIHPRSQQSKQSPPASENSESIKHFIMQLISRNRNLTFSMKNGYLLADSLSISLLNVDTTNHLHIKCLNDVKLKIIINNASKTILSPSLCQRNAQLKLQIGSDEIQEQLFAGCIENVTIAGELLLNRWCSITQQREYLNAQSDGPRPPPQNMEPLHVAESLRLNEGAIVPIQWKNIYIFPQHARNSISNEDINFRLLESPQHGQLLKEGQPVKEFTYGDILASKVHYSHDDSETTVDNIDLEVDIISKKNAVPKLRNTIYSIPVRINPVNDAPVIRPGSDPDALRISGESKLILDSRAISLWDADSDPDSVHVTVIASHGVRLEDSNGNEIRKFSQRDYLNNKIRIAHTGKESWGTLKLTASDGERQSDLLELTLRIVPIEIQLKANTGLKVVYQMSNIISSANLSFSTNLPGVLIQYIIVDLPEYGVIECRDDLGHFEICSKFTQNEIDNSRVRYRHSSAAHPPFDSFSFQIRADNTTSMVHVFRITFIPVHVKIFNRTPFLLNNTDNLTLKRDNLFAWTFPKNFATNQLVYHITEPPKFGTLSRRVEKNRNRRIGVSSNFTQKHIDDGDVTYKMHFVQYSVVNDFFTFRLIAPSVASEEIRFEITFIPGHGSIQLINRTVIVNEGGIQLITSESLSLRTPDDSDFIFTIGVAPSYGNILVKREPAGAKFALSEGDNFTTSDINSGSVFYEHLDGENRIDRIFLVAESAHRRASRVPFWLTFSMIMKNDNIPRLAGNNIILITERGDRIVHPSMLPWVDDDIDAHPLQFIFHGGFRHAAFLSKFLPTVPLQNFTQRQMQNGEVLIRHFGHSRKFKMNYTVSDGVHEVPSVLTVIASEPFIRIENSTIVIPSTDRTSFLIPITNNNLSAVTNVDSKNSDIWFKVNAGNWILVVNSTEKIVKKFTQEDIDEERLFYRFISSINNYEDQQLINVTVANLTAAQNLNILKNNLKEIGHDNLEMQRLSPLTVPLSSISQIDRNILLATALEKQPSEIVFDVIRQPIHGSLILESLKAASNGRTMTPSNFFVSRFTQAHVNAGQVQYLHNGVIPTRDSIVFNVSLGRQTIGPYTLFINVVDDEIELSVSNMTVISGSNKLLNSAILRATTADENEIEFRIFMDPEFGWLVRDTWNLSSINSIKQFSAKELNEHRIFYVNNPSSRERMDTFVVAACTTGTLRCTEPKHVNVLIRYRNLHEPELIRNEVLKMWNTQKTPITKMHLFSQDDDTPAEQVHYLISQPLNGYVAHAINPSKAIANFSQAEIDKSEIIFVKNEGVALAGGFSFLISDGLHQIGPEWFTVESSHKTKVALDANGRLVVPPGRLATIIGPDMLKVQAPDTVPRRIIYSVTKTPRFGHLLLSGLPTQKFTQEDINMRRLTYKPDNDFLDEWTKRDLFLFKVFTNNSTDDRAVDENRFKISITYAALPSHRLHEYVQLRSVVVSRGGTVAINGSHINMDVIRKYCRDELLVDFSRKPRYGRLEVLGRNGNKTNLIKVIHLFTGRSLIYRHRNEEGVLSDEILLYIVPKNDANRRTARLRVILPVILQPQKDLLTKVNRFPDRIKIVAGGEYLFTAEEFQAKHPNTQETDLEYRLLQPGSNGVILLKSEKTVTEEVFTQYDVSNGKIRLSHRQRFDTHDHTDVIVFQIGGHIRALIIDILPQSLSLYNHSDIEYYQGKTYVILNRTHLGVNTNGDHSKIIYKITKAPENGTFYWVAGEKEANVFTQRDIDEERVLYAQLNMQAFQDRFEFTVENDLKNTIRKSSHVRVLPVIHPRTLTVDASYITPITDVHLNTSILEGSAPRFLVTESPRFGRLVLSTNINESAVFFTYNDIVNSRVFYVPFETNIMVLDFIELQLDADDVQPARFRFNIEIFPSSVTDQHLFVISTTEDTKRSIPSDTSQIPPTIPSIEPVSHHVPIILLLIILAVTIFILLFRRHSTQQKRIRLINAQKKREFDAKMEANFEKQPDLLGTTVYATVGRNRLESSEKRTQRTLQTFDASRRHASWAPSSTSQRSQYRALSGGSLDYKTVSAQNTPELNRSRPDRYHSTKLKENQYWV